MVSTGSPAPDPPACPLLGLVGDRRSHFTIPHPGHRCFAKRRDGTPNTLHQTTYCLSPGFVGCGRYEAHQREGQRGKRPVTQPAIPGGSAQPGPSPAALAGGQFVNPGMVVLAFRAGDSVARIAGIYGLTVEQILEANGLTETDEIGDGRRLVIPLGLRRTGEPGVGFGPDRGG